MRRVCVFGPESTGKTTLATELAARFHTLAVPEHARAHLERSGGALREADLVDFARGQAAAEDALAERAHRLLFCDTDPLTTAIWAEALYGRVDPEITALAAARRYALTLLCDVDLPWRADVARYLPEDRLGFLGRCRAALEAHGRRYVLVRGIGPARLAAAIDAVTPLLGGAGSAARERR